MRLKTILVFIALSVLGIVGSSYFVGAVLLTRVIPFESISQQTQSAASNPSSTTSTPAKDDSIPSLVKTPVTSVSFVDADIEQGWIPWLIKQSSILIGALSLIVFFYAGLAMIIYGDTEEQWDKSIKMLIFGIIGIGLAAFSYTIVANFLQIF